MVEQEEGEGLGGGVCIQEEEGEERGERGGETEKGAGEELKRAAGWRTGGGRV